MPLQNRVTPFGEIVAHPSRGMLTGNRGILHDETGALGQARWRHRTWIACVLEFRGRWRQVNQPGRYTHLFFLDEASALAAGHRPCAECRRADYLAFRAAFARAAGADEAGLRAPAMDARLHEERVVPRRWRQRTHAASLARLPDGAMIALGSEAFLVLGDTLVQWSPGGYVARRERPRVGEVTLLTPPSIVGALLAGYTAALHPSAHS